MISRVAINSEAPAHVQRHSLLMHTLNSSRIASRASLLVPGSKLVGKAGVPAK